MKTRLQRASNRFQLKNLQVSYLRAVDVSLCNEPPKTFRLSDSTSTAFDTAHWLRTFHDWCLVELDHRSQQPKRVILVQ